MSMHSQKKLKQALDDYVAEQGEPRYLCAVIDFQKHNDLHPGDNIVIGLYHAAPNAVKAFYFRNNSKSLDFAEQGDIETLAQAEFYPEQEAEFTGQKPSLMEILRSPRKHLSSLIRKDELWSYLSKAPEVHDMTWLF